MTRTIASLADLSGAEIRAAVGAVAEADSARRGALPAPSAASLAGRVVGVLSFVAPEHPAAPWIAAAGRLGATVIRRDDLSDATARPLAAVAEAGACCDALVTCHSLAGFARAAAGLSRRPVLNGGETHGEDPVAGLSLLAAALRDDVAARPRVAVCGDLATSRSARAFLSALAAVEATVLLVPAKGRDLPESEIRRLARRMGRSPLRFEAHAMSSLLDMVDTVLLSPDATTQLPLFQEVGVPQDDEARRARREVEDLDILFVAAPPGGADRLVRDPFRGRSPARAMAQGGEHVVSQGAYAALLSLALGSDVAQTAPQGAAQPPADGARSDIYRSALGLCCRGERCVASRHPDHVEPQFAVLDDARRRLACLYCGETTEATLAASKVERRFHPAGSADAQKIHSANLVLFRTQGEALAAGFGAPRRSGRGGDEGESA